MNDTDGIRAHILAQQFPESWSSSEIARLRSLASAGAETVAEVLGRSVSSVRAQAHRQGISLRPAGQRRGRLIGIPNGLGRSVLEVERLRRMRELVLSGEVDPAAVVRYVRAVERGEDLCPRCGRNPAEVPQSGWCRPCHLRTLTEGVEYALEVRDEERRNDRARQQKHRAKVRTDD